MRVDMVLLREKNKSITVEMNLQHYLPLFLRINEKGRPLELAEQNAFNHAFSKVSAHFAGVGAESLMEDIKELLLQQYSPLEQTALLASPVFNLIGDAYTEIFKNAIDIVLEQHIKKLSNPATKVKVNIHMEKFLDRVTITFSDSGPGFTQSIRDKLNTEANQLKYSEQHQGSQKNAAKYKGMMGGRGRGLRNIIALVLSGEPLHPGKNVQRAKHFNSEIHFTNANNPYCPGACIEMTAQLAPISILAADNLQIRQESNDSASSHITLPDFSLGDTSASRKTSNLADISLNLDPSNNHNVPEISSALPKKKSLMLSLDLDDLGPRNTSHFPSDSPMIQKKPRSRGLSPDSEGHTDISSLSCDSPEVQKKSQPTKVIQANEPKDSHNNRPLRNNIDRKSSRAKQFGFKSKITSNSGMPIEQDLGHTEVEAELGVNNPRTFYK